MIFSIYSSLTFGQVGNIFDHVTCESALEICQNEGSISGEILNSQQFVNGYCQPDNKMSQYMIFDYEATGDIHFNSQLNDGTITFYGPFSNSGGSDYCSQISSGTIDSVSMGFSKGLPISTSLNNSGIYILKMTINCININGNVIRGIDLELRSKSFKCPYELCSPPGQLQSYIHNDGRVTVSWTPVTPPPQYGYAICILPSGQTPTVNDFISVFGNHYTTTTPFSDGNYQVFLLSVCDTTQTLVSDIVTDGITIDLNLPNTENGSGNSGNIDDHTDCVTALEVCDNAQIAGSIPSFSPKRCINSHSSPVFFSFNFTQQGNFQLYSPVNEGHFVLYGPMQGIGVDYCDQIALGNISDTLGSFSVGQTVNIPHLEGYYLLGVAVKCVKNNKTPIDSLNIQISTNDTDCEVDRDCQDCLSTFSPTPGKYILSAWTKGENNPQNYSYQTPKIKVSFSGSSVNYNFSPQGTIIDDWQRIDGILDIPIDATTIKIELKCESGDCYFDDIRFVPVDGSMISYVYDAKNSRLLAELDERNFATFYEYNEEGKLIRLKKETEKGIMTIQEHREKLKNEE